jgi:tricarballylate dehydrogenase
MDVNATSLKRTINEFNAACPADKQSTFDPHQFDGLTTADSLPVPKSNWALSIDKAPYEAYAVTCGITFTYGGIQTDTRARVLNNEGRHMPGLWAIGEITGGVSYLDLPRAQVSTLIIVKLFYHNYPGGAGLTRGAVFGRIAGQEAAQTKVQPRSRL